MSIYTPITSRKLQRRLTQATSRAEKMMYQLCDAAPEVKSSIVSASVPKSKSPKLKKGWRIRGGSVDWTWFLGQENRTADPKRCALQKDE